MRFAVLAVFAHIEQRYLGAVMQPGLQGRGVYVLGHCGVIAGHCRFMGQRLRHWWPAEFGQNAPLAEDSHRWQGEGNRSEAAVVADALARIDGPRGNQRRVCTPTDITW
ncbi:hypothetical protein GCM10009078_01540 [Cupriavidus gilardii]